MRGKISLLSNYTCSKLIFFYRMTIWISSIRASSKKYDLQKIFNNVIIFIVILAPRLQLYNKRFRHENSTHIYCLTIELVTIKIP